MPPYRHINQPAAQANQLVPPLQPAQARRLTPTASTPITGLYTFLPLREQQIRLLQIRSDHGEVNCHLEVFAIDQAPAFLALSYEWASADDPVRISINKEEHELRRNLYDFIQRTTVDYNFALRWWWIDALCINQADLQERGHQVSLMAQIYRRADSVVAWLGLARDYCQIAVHKIRSFRTDQYHEKAWTRHECRAVVDLCQRAYWTRLWVLQELALSQHTVFLIGNIKIEGSIMADFADGLISGDLAAFSSYADLRHLIMHSPALSMLGESRKSRDSISLCQRVIGSSHLQCSSEHDKIFAVISISDPATSQHLEPDYQMRMEVLLYKLLCSDLTATDYTHLDSHHIYDMFVGIYKLTEVIPLGLKVWKRLLGAGEQACITCDSESSEGRHLLTLLPRPDPTATIRAPWLAYVEGGLAHYPPYVWFDIAEDIQISGSALHRTWLHSAGSANGCVFRELLPRGRPIGDKKLPRGIWSADVSDALIDSRDDWD